MKNLYTNIYILLALAMCTVTAAIADENTSALPPGLQVLYEFNEREGDRILDRSHSGAPIHLTIGNAENIAWQAGALRVNGETRIVAEDSAKRLYDAIRWSGQLTLEAWIEPASLDQSGPARIITFSESSSQRNFTLGQDGAGFDLRLRTSQTNLNGLPSVSSNGESVSQQKTHVVYTRNHFEEASIYVNGELVFSGRQAGDFANWNSEFLLGLGNEINGSRPWLGTFYRVAIYNRSLTSTEIQHHFQNGSEADFSFYDDQEQFGDNFFIAKVAPLFVQHCYECHDSSTREGGLDVTNRAALMAGGNSGQMIVPGEADQSILMNMVDQNVMPLARQSLSQAEKDALRKWIDEGAEWPVERIEASVYAHGAHDPEGWVQRLTRQEYIETVRAVIGIDISEDAKRLLPQEIRADGFSNTAYNLSVDFQHIQAYSELASIIVNQIDIIDFVLDFTKNTLLVPENIRHVIQHMGEWVLRGPLTESEIQDYQEIANIVIAAGGQYEEVCKQVLRAMLQSPRFIYRLENQSGDGRLWPRNDYELAAKLSYIFWGGPPDPPLLRAAQEGRLTTPEGFEEQLERLIEDPRVKERAADFFADWLNLDALLNLRPNPERFPTWSEDVARDMKRESTAFFTYVAMERDQPLTKLFNAQVTFLTQRLAEHYGMQPPPNADSASELVRYDLTDIPERGGILTQGSVLTKGGDDASMVTRGLFVLHQVLRGIIQDPPPGVDTTPVPSEPGLSQRQISEQRVANPSCGGCHHKFEPLAFGLERFNGAGTYAEQDEYGNPLRQDGEILFPGERESKEFSTSAELMDLLANNERVQETVTWKVIQFALGRPLTPSDLPHLNEINSIAKSNGGTYIDVLIALAKSDLVRMKPTEEYHESSSHS